MNRKTRTVAVSAVLISAVVAVTGGQQLPATAQTDPAPGPVAPPTTNPIEGLLNGLLSPPPPSTTLPSPSATGGQPGAGSAVGAPPGTPPAPPPPDEVVCTASVAPAERTSPRSGPRDTGALLAALSSGKSAGPADQAAIVAGMGRFPVGGLANYTDDWLAPRSTPCPHLHMGTDVFAAGGTPIRAPDAGVVRFAEEAVGGKTASVITADGTMYYMAHMSDFPNELQSGSRVQPGTVVGFVGNTGNASGGSTHLHIQIHPGGGAPVNPKPILDGWLDQALAAAMAPATEPVPPITGQAFTGLHTLRRFDTSSGASQGEDWSQASELAHALVGPLTPLAVEYVLDGSNGARP